MNSPLGGAVSFPWQQGLLQR